MQKSMSNRIKGALYAFAIGDAMGATTEFMYPPAIRKKYGEVKDILGGGWLNIEKGQVTDDTQMTLAVCDAIERSDGVLSLLNNCCDNFTKWFEQHPIDVGNCCKKVITSCKGKTNDQWIRYSNNPISLGNGSLMRSLPMVLSGQSDEITRLQGRLTHGNSVCDNELTIYRHVIRMCLRGNEKSVEELFLKPIMEPYGHVTNTLYNAIHWAIKCESLEAAIMCAVNMGGDADTIAAVTGSIVGSIYGYDAIPQRWIDQLNPGIKKELDHYAKLFIKMYK